MRHPETLSVEQRELVNAVRGNSMSACEACGEPGELSVAPSWMGWRAPRYVCRCAAHRHAQSRPLPRLPAADPRAEMHTPEQMDLLLRHEQIFGPIWLECGPGWTALLDELCTGLQRLTDDEGAPQVVAQHVKEKLGGMRFYCRRASESQRALIEATKARANVTCETCSDPGSVYVAGGWLSCKCPTHAPEGGMLRVEAIADRERRAREAEAQQQAEKGEGGE